MKERDLQKLILDWLTIHRIFHWRNNTGAMHSEYKGKRRFMRFGSLGSPDIFAMRWILHRGSILFGIEVKGPKGYPSDAQVSFRQEFERAGGEYILARSLEDVIARLG